MPAPRKYRQELRQRPIRLVVEVREQDPEVPVTRRLSVVMRIGSRTGAESRGGPPLRRCQADLVRRPLTAAATTQMIYGRAG